MGPFQLRSWAIMAKAMALSKGGLALCKSFSSSAASSPMMSGRWASVCPILRNTGPSPASPSRSIFPRVRSASGTSSSRCHFRHIPRKARTISATRMATSSRRVEKNASSLSTSKPPRNVAYGPSSTTFFLSDCDGNWSCSRAALSWRPSSISSSIVSSCCSKACSRLAILPFALLFSLISRTVARTVRQDSMAFRRSASRLGSRLGGSSSPSSTTTVSIGTSAVWALYLGCLACRWTTNTAKAKAHTEDASKTGYGPRADLGTFTVGGPRGCNTLGRELGTLSEAPK
mmetsp:Transcript_73852/g.130244  ORF Transcript_73852/g.130244 Transcript_73852/m.130244 type:complete len:288 (+) Transcript_73852:3517-4380(+)